MVEIPNPVRVDLDKGIKKTYLDTVFATEDDKAHRFDVSLYLNKIPLELSSGAKVSAYFIRYCDNGTFMLDGTANGNVASVILKKECYNKSGAFALIIKVTEDGVTSTVFYGEGSMFASRTDTIIDPENIIPSLEELLAQIDNMEKAAEETRAATEAAKDATEVAKAATTACNSVTNEARKWTRATATAERLAEGSTPTVTVQNSASKMILHFGIPEGASFKYEDFTPEQLAALSPKRGTDYWTEADIAVIKGYVDDSIVNGSW